MDILVWGLYCQASHILLESTSGEVNLITLPFLTASTFNTFESNVSDNVVSTDLYFVINPQGSVS